MHPLGRRAVVSHIGYQIPVGCLCKSCLDIAVSYDGFTVAPCFSSIIRNGHQGVPETIGVERENHSSIFQKYRLVVGLPDAPTHQRVSEDCLLLTSVLVISSTVYTSD